MHQNLETNCLPCVVQCRFLIRESEIMDSCTATAVGRSGRGIHVITLCLSLRPLIAHVFLAHIQLNGFIHIPVENHLSLIQHNAPVAQAADGVHVVADVQNRPALLLGGLTHFVQTLLLERHVAHCQNLVHDHDLAV